MVDTEKGWKDMNDLSDIVKKILTEHKEARDDDFKVIGWVVKAMRPDIMGYSFGSVLWNHAAFGLPSFETIRRTRQKLQHDNPELRGDLYMKRMEKQTEFIEKFSEVS